MMILFLLADQASGVLASASAIKHVRQLDRKEREAGLLPYLLYLPASYRESEQSWPLLVYLHGSRGRGADPSKLAKYPVPRLAEAGDAPMPFIVLAPQCPSDLEWSEIRTLEALVELISSNYRVDRQRTYLVGQSMGATGIWQLAARSPDRYAAIAPMFGEADLETAPALKELPIWVFHGERDTVVPIRHSDEMVAALAAAGSTSVRYTRDPEGYHRPPDDSSFAELFDWLLGHRSPSQ